MAGVMRVFIQIKCMLDTVTFMNLKYVAAIKETYDSVLL
jgi:hypothetical protein